MAIDLRDDVIERDETSDLIASNRVEGAAVYNRQGERLGTVSHFMVGKRSGRVEYAVMSFGGLFGLGESHHPLPWDVLTTTPTRAAIWSISTRTGSKARPPTVAIRSPAGIATMVVVSTAITA